MSFLLRHLLLFFLPIALGFALHYATFPLRAEFHRQSVEFLGAFLSGDPEDARVGLRRVFESAATLPGGLDWMSRVTVVAGLGSFSLLIPKTAPQQRAVNLLTTLCVGFGFAKTLGLFFGLDWADFALCLIFGLCLAIVVLSLRLKSLTKPDS